MRDKIAGHSFAILMKSIFKHWVTVIMLLIVSGTAMYANNSASLFYSPFTSINNAKNAPTTLLSQNKNIFFTQNILFNNHLITDAFFLEIEEEEQGVKKISDIQGISSFKSLDSNFNRHFLKAPVLLKLHSGGQYFTFFKSKTATSLYLLFEVFRI